MVACNKIRKYVTPTSVKVTHVVVVACHHLLPLPACLKSKNIFAKMLKDVGNCRD